MGTNRHDAADAAEPFEPADPADAFVRPVVLEGHGVRLAPLGREHSADLSAASRDGELWRIRVTSVPHPDDAAAYVDHALAMRAAGQRFAFAVFDATGALADASVAIGSTSYHDIVPAVRRLEIGWTWYAARAQRSHVNTAAKLLLMAHAFDALGCHVVGWRTDNFNFRSQRAIERLGARKDGVIRGHALRRDGTIRDTVMYSLRSGEWPETRAQLLDRMARRTAAPDG